jgi:hypothetical protein
MRKLEIAITKAQLTSFSVTLNEDKPKVDATISLLTDGGRNITNYTISTESWREEQQYDLPLSAIKPITEIMEILERVVVKHCKSNVPQLKAKN